VHGAGSRVRGLNIQGDSQCPSGLPLVRSTQRGPSPPRDKVDYPLRRTEGGWMGQTQPILGAQKRRVQGAPWQGSPCTRSLAVVFPVGLWSTPGECGGVSPRVQGTASPARGNRGESPENAPRAGGPNTVLLGCSKEKGAGYTLPGLALVKRGSAGGQGCRGRRPLLGVSGENPLRTPRGRAGGTKLNPSWAPEEEGPGRALVHPARACPGAPHRCETIIVHPLHVTHLKEVHPWPDSSPSLLREQASF